MARTTRLALAVIALVVSVNRPRFDAVSFRVCYGAAQLQMASQVQHLTATD
jgi:hypothetical protein